jgi:hypothetical protein
LRDDDLLGVLRVGERLLVDGDGPLGRWDGAAKHPLDLLLHAIVWGVMSTDSALS